MAILHTINPATNQPNPWQFEALSEAQINEAVLQSAIAFEQYKLLEDGRKAAFLNSIADEILQLGDELLDAYVLESGLPKSRAESERGRTLGQLRSFAQMLAEGSWVEASIDTAEPDRKPIPKVDLRKMLMPIGPIVVFGSSNFPLAYSTAGGDTASALAAGCTVIVKSHSMHIKTGALVAQAIEKAKQQHNIPVGTFINLIGAGNDIGQQLVAHPLVKGVGFTGSIKGGRALYDIAAKRPEPIPVFAEMGSINPVVILPKALESKNEFWANQYAASITLGTGQFCTNPGLLIALQGPGLDTFIKNLSTELLAVNNSCMLHPAIKQNFESGKATVKNIPNVLVVQEKAAEEHTNLAGSCIVKVSGETFLKNHQLKEEVFGPFSIIVECVDNDELIKVIQQLQGQLTGTIISDEHEIAHYTLVVDALHTKVGRLIHNGVPTGVEVCTSMLHGGPYPASTDSRFTAVGIHAVKRWVRPVSYQNWPNSLLPLALQNDNPLQIMRTVNNTLSKEKIING